MNAATSLVTKVSGSSNVIRRFTLRRVVTGAMVFGLFAAVESVAQGAGIIAAFPNAAERAKVVYGLASNSALGLFYGDKNDNITSPSGYMVYRILPVLAMVGAVWGLTFITKMLRGQEENGRWELFLAGQASARSATTKTIIGAGSGLLIAYGLTLAVLLISGRSSKFSLPIGGSLLYSAAVVAGAAVALGLGAITSQLAATRRRAVLYGLIPLIAFFILRSIGNVVGSLAWLKNLTPFGWIDKLHPYYHSQATWLLPLFGLMLLCCGLGIWLAGRRDMLESFIADSTSAKPKFILLSSQPRFYFRQVRNVLVGWLATSAALVTVIAAVDKTVAKSLSGTGALSKAIDKFAGNPTSGIELAYLGAASYLTLIVLLIMVTTSIGATREEEASGRLDNFVSGIVSRLRWLNARLLITIGAAFLITLICNSLVWALAEMQGIHVGASSMLLGGLNILGPVFFLLGVGVLFFGLLPKLAAIAMYIVIGWSFTIDIVASVLKLSKYLADTSLLHHISLVPAVAPKWESFGVLSVLGLVFMALGMVLFKKRDLAAE